MRVHVQCCFTSTKTVRLIRTGSPGRPPGLSHSSWTPLFTDTYSFPLPSNAAGICVTLFSDVPSPFRYAGLCVSLTQVSLSVKCCWYICHTIQGRAFPFPLCWYMCVTLFTDTPFPFPLNAAGIYVTYTIQGISFPFPFIAAGMCQTIYWHAFPFSFKCSWYVSDYLLTYLSLSV